jgi:hypothetical protein
MGLNVPSLQLFCCAKNIGVDFSETIMLGRQKTSMPMSDAAAILSKIGISRNELSNLEWGQFAEPIFELLGAKQVSSLDACGYENATYNHDLNTPLLEHLRENFSVVFDGGTIEHIFNIPQALKNCMEMVRVGGHFIQVNNANNYMGHGFWQFCPELLYRVFSHENGFLIKAVLLHEPLNTPVKKPPPGAWQGASFGNWYAVRDPAIVRSRVELINHRPTLICTIAQRISRTNIFANIPQQSDYVVIWKQDRQSPTSASLAPTSSRLRRLLPSWIKSILRPIKNAFSRKGPFDRPYYCYVSDDDLVSGRFLGQSNSAKSK